MTFQTETVLSCSVPPSPRGFEKLNTEKPPDRQREERKWRVLPDRAILP
jgi:hypothetical protein